MQQNAKAVLVQSVECIIPATGVANVAVTRCGFLLPTHSCTSPCAAKAGSAQHTRLTDSWLLQYRLHGALAASAVRDSATAVHQELLECYALIEKLGRGVVYYGSARLKQDSPHWGRAVELGRQVAQLLHCTTWSGGGPGMMEAATAGVLC